MSSRLSVLCGKYSKKVMLGDVEVELKLVNVSDLADLVDASKNIQQGKMDKTQLVALAGVLKSMLRKSDPDATEQELDEVVITYMPVLSEALAGMMDDIFAKKGDGQKKV